jgi:hypothetical protein
MHCHPDGPTMEGLCSNLMSSDDNHQVISLPHEVPIITSPGIQSRTHDDRHTGNDWTTAGGMKRGCLYMLAKTHGKKLDKAW